MFLNTIEKMVQITNTVVNILTKSYSNFNDL